MLLANASIKKGELEQAVPHLEMAAKHSPNAPVVLNNLALALARTKSDSFERCLELLDRALKITGPAAEIFDSQGEVYMHANQPLDAIQSFERAIGMDPGRVKTRQWLINAYEQAGLPAMAETQRKALEKLGAGKP